MGMLRLADGTPDEPPERVMLEGDLFPEPEPVDPEELRGALAGIKERLDGQLRLINEIAARLLTAEQEINRWGGVRGWIDKVESQLNRFQKPTEDRLTSAEAAARTTKSQALIALADIEEIKKRLRGVDRMLRRVKPNCLLADERPKARRKTGT